MADAAPTLFVIGTPIGNLEDVTLRCLRVLGQLDALACEDTRHTRKIFERHNVRQPAMIFSHHEHNEDRVGERILQLLSDGRSVGLCTKAGFPGISDPGYPVIAKARDAGFRVEVIPGVGAVETALVASGLPTSSYTFKGFPPKKSGRKRRFLDEEKDRPHTLVFFESPHRLADLLAEAREVYGDRLAAVCVEMTKVFEEIHRGYLDDLALKFRDANVKGEITVVIAGNNPKFTKAPAT